jgi:hypothetical protein
VPRQPLLRRLGRGALPGAVAVLTILSVSCSSAPELDRERAIQEVLDANAGRLSRDQAACVVDRVVAEVGAAQLQAGAVPSPQQVDQLTSIKVDCVGVANLGLNPATSTSAPRATGSGSYREPQRFGDDPRLDALYSACQQGSGPACDQLFDQSGLGTDYEEFASTCGGRTREIRCADRYPGAPITGTGAPPSTGR